MKKSGVTGASTSWSADTTRNGAKRKPSSRWNAPTRKSLQLPRAKSLWEPAANSFEPVLTRNSLRILRFPISKGPILPRSFHQVDHDILRPHTRLIGEYLDNAPEELFL